MHEPFKNDGPMDALYALSLYPSTRLLPLRASAVPARDKHPLFRLLEGRYSQMLNPLKVEH